jgi:hypothetical protein
MAAIAHAVAEQTTEQTSGSSVYADITGASIASGSFTAGKKYLLLVTAQLRNTSANGTNSCRLVHGTTAFAESEMAATRDTPSAQVYAFMTVWTAVASEAVKLQFKTSGGFIAVDHIALIAINLSDDVTENTDWFFAERTTDDALSTTMLDGAGITITGISSDWLVISFAQIDPGDTSNAFITQMQRSGEASSATPESRFVTTSAGSLWPMLMARVFTIGAAANTFKERAATTFGTAHTRLHSSIFAINLAKFKVRAFAYTDADTGTLSTTPYGTQVQTASITPTVTGDVLLLAYVGYDRNSAGVSGAFRVQVDNVDQPAGQTSAALQLNYGIDASDELPLSLVTMPSLSNAAHTVDIDASDSGSGVATAQHRQLVAVTMELATVVSTAKGLASINRGVARGVSRGMR